MRLRREAKASQKFRMPDSLTGRYSRKNMESYLVKYKNGETKVIRCKHYHQKGRHYVFVQDNGREEKHPVTEVEIELIMDTADFA